MMADALIFSQVGRIREADVPLVGFGTSTASTICFTQSSQKALQVRPLPLKYRKGLALLNRVSRQNHGFDR
ncbi:hypothetical protein MicvaDRAFT_5311 [Microcoleus vaginatus FGP-2]|nr:hypothetical protein MicvaDRAFT_5311 [Microcoleus vaginatus FGP-2]